MADEQKEKSPEELGEAVGKKIEALFGGLFGEEATQELDVMATFRDQQAVAGSQTRPARRATDDTATVEIPPPVPKTPTVTPVQRPVPPPPQPVAAPKPAPVPVTPGPRAAAAGIAAAPSPAPQPPSQPFDDLAELIEALILNLEWEVTPEVIAEVADRFKELDAYFAANTQGRSVLAMNYRVLQRFRSPDATSHPSLVKMLQDSLTVLKLIRSSPENRQAIDSLVAGVTEMYKVISAAAAPQPTPPPPPAPKPRPEPVLEPIPDEAVFQPRPEPVRQPSVQPVARPVPSAPPAAPARPIQPAPAPAAPRPLAPPVKETSDQYRALTQRVTSAVQSLEEVNRRLGAVLRGLRLDGELAGEEVNTELVEQLMARTESAAGGIRDSTWQELFSALIKKNHIALQSLEEVNQRFSRILGVFRQGGDMSGEEIIRRLGTLEHLFSERLGQLSSVHRQLAAIPAPSSGGGSATGRAADGLLTLIWEGTPLAIPSTLVIALFQLPKPQADQFARQSSVTLGGRNIPRLPLKRPPSAPQRTETASWLVHLSVGGKDWFILADRSLGYRTAPAGVDVNRQTRVSIGTTSFAVLNQAAFR